jgi:folate-binding protein YgfZ
MLNHREMNSAFLPLELKLNHMVNLNKGCYPGQEIHARMDSRGKASRGIVRLSLPSVVGVGKHKIAGIGNITITTSTITPEGSVALAVVPISAIGIEEMELGDGLMAVVQSL